jgi:CRP/FNR family cyclic AMP-dependent transcriptional regulator
MEHMLAWMHSPHFHGWNDDIVGYIASAVVLATFSMRSMQSLRMIAIASNLAFITYAVVADLRPILILHGILFL